VKGRWLAIDSSGATIDFLLSALRDAAAAKRLFRRALSDPPRKPGRLRIKGYQSEHFREVRSERGAAKPPQA
jgi:transposase-like protein